MSSTRISAAQLVDWTDQAILYLRVGGDTEAKSIDRRKGAGAKAAKADADGTGANATPPPQNNQSLPPTPEPAGVTGAVSGAIAGALHTEHGAVRADGVVPKVHENLARLRTYGIRTATDLLQEYNEALRRGGDNDAARTAEIEAFRRALDLRGDGSKTHVYPIQTIIDTLADEEWFVPLRNWRASEFGDFDAWYTYLDGHDWQLQTATDIPPRVNAALQPFEAIAMAPPAASAVTVATNGDVTGGPAKDVAANKPQSVHP
jgi:hypothetical protein